MSEDTLNQGRRSTRLSISIPVIISGVDADGNDFRESVRTLIVNKHGGKVGTVHHLALGAEVTVENAALSVLAKANVVWFSGKQYAGDLHHVGLQLIEAQNVWGIAFPPDDWSTESPDETSAEPEIPPESAPVTTAGAETPLSSLENEEITIRLLQELQQSADDHAREFKDRVKQLTNRVGLELELELRERAASAKAREVGALQDEIKTLKESLSASSKEIGELQLRMQEIKGALQDAAQNPAQPALPMQEARRQLAAMANSVVARMNTAAAEGLSEYRSLLQKENQETAERLRRAAEKPPLSRLGATPES